MPTARLPAEWEPQTHIIITWPHAQSDWLELLHTIEPAYVAFANTILSTTPLLVICQDKNVESKVHATCHHANLMTLVQQTNDTWVRDYGPISVLNTDEVISLDFQFNGWGEKYDYRLDNQLNSVLQKHVSLQQHKARQHPLILEGGSIDSNGQGMLLTTTSCLLKRNKLSKKAYQDLFKELLGVDTCCWISDSFLQGDDTDGHIDNLARFINTNQIVYLTCNQKDIHYPHLASMEKTLRTWARDYPQIELIPVPLPEKIAVNSERLPASYINFLITNGQIILPIFNQAQDNEALSIFKALRPDYQITPLEAIAFIQQGGGPHCASMQVPALGQNINFE